MMRDRTRALALILAVLAAQPGARAAQPADLPDDDGGYRRQVFRLGTDYTLHSGDAVREVAVVFGNATIEGHVRDTVVVVLGTATLASTAIIDRDFVVVGGQAIVAPGAQVAGDLAVIAAGLDAPPDFSPQGQQVIIGTASIGGRFDAISSWLVRGVLFGRPIVPDLVWVWVVVGILFFVYLLVSLLFDRSVGASAATLRQKPLTTFGAGLLVLLLLGPVFFLLTVTLIGIAVIPVLMCALLVAALVGKAGAARWIGSRIVSESEPPQRAESLRSVALGLAVIVVAYMIPVLGFVTWTLTSVLGIGAATLAFVSTYRRENPSPALPVPHAVPAPPPLVAADAAWDGEIPPVAVPRPALASAPPVVAAADVVALPRASFRDRFFAFLLDVILVLIARQILDRFGDGSEYFLWLLVYHIGFWTWKGTTVGGIICQLRVVRADGTPVRFVDARSWPVEHLLAGRARNRLPVDPERSGPASVARQDRGHLCRQGAQGGRCSLQLTEAIDRIGPTVCRKRSTVAMPSARNPSRTKSCAIANGGSLCVGASAFSAGTFRNSCTGAPWELARPGVDTEAKPK